VRWHAGSTLTHFQMRRPPRTLVQRNAIHVRSAVQALHHPAAGVQQYRTSPNGSAFIEQNVIPTETCLAFVGIRVSRIFVVIRVEDLG
jgi:hypothetical protein